MSEDDPERQGGSAPGRARRRTTDETSCDDRDDAAPSGSWTRSFPPGTIEGDDWMVDVLDDLRAYASTHDLEEIADTLSETRRLVIAHLLATRH